jgi:signal transduction histidine kinase
MEHTREQITVKDNFEKAKGEDLPLDLQSQYQQICEILISEDEIQKKEFIAMASHQLNTPMTSIKVYTQILHEIMKEKGDDSSARILLRMEEQIDKLISLIKNMLDISKLSERKLTFKREDYNMNDLINKVVHETQLTTMRHVIETDLRQTHIISGDKEKTSQVLINLLLNAIKYSPEAEKIIVTSRSTDQEITVCVRDFGIGILKEIQKNLFKRFFRVIDESTKTLPGLGLGLFFATEIVQQQNGRIWVDSAAGNGSSFFFSLPYSQ